MRKPDFKINVWEFYWDTMKQFNVNENNWYHVRYNEDKKILQYATIQESSWTSYNSLVVADGEAAAIAYLAYHKEIEKILLVGDKE